MSLSYQFQAQDSFWELQLEGGKIITPITLHKLDEDTLFIDHLRLNQKADIMKIQEIRIVRDGSFWRGAEKGMWIGSSIGLAYGLIQNLATRPKGGTFGNFFTFSKEPYNVTFAIANEIVDAIWG